MLHNLFHTKHLYLREYKAQLKEKEIVLLDKEEELEELKKEILRKAFVCYCLL